MANLIKVLYKQKSFQTAGYSKNAQQDEHTQIPVLYMCITTYYWNSLDISKQLHVLYMSLRVYTVNIFYEVTEYYVVENNNNYNNEYFV